MYSLAALDRSMPTVVSDIVLFLGLQLDLAKNNTTSYNGE